MADYDRVHTFLQNMATQRRIKVLRTSRADIGNWSHDVSFLDADGEQMAWTCGYILDIDVALGKWDEKYVKWSERVDDKHTKIHLMISVSPPRDGTVPELERVDLGFNGNDHYYGFDVVMHNDDIEDDFE
jgi:hypothetical protein